MWVLHTKMAISRISQKRRSEEIHPRLESTHCVYNGIHGYSIHGMVACVKHTMHGTGTFRLLA